MMSSPALLTVYENNSKDASGCKNQPHELKDEPRINVPSIQDSELTGLSLTDFPFQQPEFSNFFDKIAVLRLNGLLIPRLVSELLLDHHSST
jgi:hypothetical protein